MPLVEAIFDFKWRLTPSPERGGAATDPNYKLVLGSFFGQVKTEYPVPEELPAARVPDEFVPHIVQHRFRREQDGYPLVQLGPGILAVNDTSGYSWTTFEPRIAKAIADLLEVYPGTLAAEAVLLRFVNAIPLNFAEADAFQVLRDSLNVDVRYPADLFDGVPADKRPSTLAFESSHRLTDPPGMGIVKFSSGEVGGVPHLLFETNVVSAGDEAPGIEALKEWLASAHNVSRSWFFALIKGPLEDRLRA